ncbi:Gfo/Idh/MocA family oxidoreductase [Streptomyces sp. HUAS ZL42]|uniref:Gfo/Idh/MocA family oxidoreductase n=1 Tax=Streptomyces sp. HUAS ZL42 TaxID=3231715 RepID=UPI00345E2CDE
MSWAPGPQPSVRPTAARDAARPWPSRVPAATIASYVVRRGGTGAPGCGWSWSRKGMRGLLTSPPRPPWTPWPSATEPARGAWRPPLRCRFVHQRYQPHSRRRAADGGLGPRRFSAGVGVAVVAGSLEGSRGQRARPGETATVRRASCCDADLLVITTGVHEDLVEEPLDAGAHVVTEKPVCLDVVRTRKLAARTRDAGLLLEVGAMPARDPALHAAPRPRARARRRLAPDAEFSNCWSRDTGCADRAHPQARVRGPDAAQRHPNGEQRRVELRASALCNNPPCACSP